MNNKHNHTIEFAPFTLAEGVDEATLIAFGLTLTVQHYTDLDTVELFYLDQAALAELIDNRQPLYLLVDPVNIETQWRGQPLARNFEWLAQHAKLVPVGDLSAFRLYQVLPVPKIE